MVHILQLWNTYLFGFYRKTEANKGGGLASLSDAPALKSGLSSLTGAPLLKESDSKFSYIFVSWWL